jgi:hypothetical protein
VAFLAGMLDYAKLGAVHRTLIKLVFRLPAGDNRNWSAIHEWALRLRSVLLPSTAAWPSQAAA